MSPLLPSVQVDAFQKDGFLILKHCFEPDEVRMLRQLLEAPSLVEAIRQRGPAGQIFQLGDYDPFFSTLAVDPRILDPVEAIIGPNIQLQHSKLTYKTAGAGELRWHQDLVYTPHSCPDLLSVALYVDDVNALNGCMTTVAGSHLEGLRDHYLGERFTGVCQQPEAYADAERHRLLEVDAGGLSLHHCLILHGSVPHASIGPRRMIVFAYRASHAIQLGGPTFTDTGRQVRGTFDGVVRCVQMTYRLPPLAGKSAVKRDTYQSESQG